MARLRTLEVGDRLGRLALETAGDGRLELRRGGREASILFLAHGVDCAGCRRYLEGPARGAPTLALWDARVIVVLPDGAPIDGPSADPPIHALREPAALSLVLDRDDRLRGRCGLGDATGLLIADRFGEVFVLRRARRATGLPDPADLDEWARFLATQCPECGVPDRPDPVGRRTG